jgi:anti-sigma factor RsiW
MNCSEVRPLLEAHADGELDLVRQLEIEAHVQSCPACAAQANAIAARREALRQSLPRFGAPAVLRGAVLALARSGSAPAAQRPDFRPAALGHLAYLGGIAAAVAACLFTGYAWGTTRARSHALLDEAVSGHVRSLQAGHLMDVVSTDQHTVKPWFVGKLDFSPPVVDLSSDGFPLAGGRLEQIDGRPAAALVFHRRLHTINLFIWPAAAGAMPSRTGAEKGYNAEGWSQGGMNFLAVSEIPASDLAQFTAAYRARLNP